MKLNKDKLDCDLIKSYFQYFPNLIRHMSYDWLERKCAAGPPYHQLLLWLSKIATPEQIKQLVVNYRSEQDDTERRLKKVSLKNMFWALTWVNHVDTCLGFFGRENEQGKGIIIKILRDNNFYPFLSQLEIGLILKHHGYDVVLEDTSIIQKPRIDILAVKGRSLIFELATPEMYLPLRRSGVASNVPDRVRSTLLGKINDQLHKFIHKTSAPIIIVFNLTGDPDADCRGVLYSLKGINISHMDIDESGIIGTHTDYERDPKFTTLEAAKRLSAVICYKAKNTNFEIKFEGEIITNDSALVKLSEGDISEIKDVLFGDYVSKINPDFYNI